MEIENLKVFSRHYILSGKTQNFTFFSFELETFIMVQKNLELIVSEGVSVIIPLFLAWFHPNIKDEK